MRRVLGLLAIFLLARPAVAPAEDKKPKPGPLMGTWECLAHGTEQGDMPFTLLLTHTKETVGGSVNSPLGGTQITSGTFKKKKLEIRIETPQGIYLLTGKYRKGQLAGEWSQENGPKGTWEGKKQANP